MTDNPIPGDKPMHALLDEMIRVDHAGEYGAQQIYKGQLAVLGREACAPMLQQMAQQEQEHLQTFESFMRQHRVRPTALLPFWHLAGFALGAGTALMGTRAAMACTVAVESVIAEHYQEQLEALGDREPQLRAAIERFRREEIEHHDIGIEHEAEKTPFYGLLSGAIQVGCRAAIWVAKRI